MDNKYRTLHETPIRAAIDIYDTIKAMDGKDILDKANRSPYASTSIARIASNMTLVFPMMCSTNLHIDTAMMIMKALERKYTVMLQILFSAYQVTDVKSAQDFISRFHSNIKFSNKASVDDFIDLADTFAESGRMTVDQSELARLSKDFRENCFFVLDDDFAPTSIAENYNTVTGGIRHRAINEKFDPNTVKGFKGGTIGDKKYKGANTQGNISNAPATGVSNNKPTPITTNGLADRIADKLGKNFHDNGHDNSNNEPDEYNSRIMKDMSSFLSSQILDSDIKKANELVPTTMIVNFKYVDPDSGRATPLDNIVLGIKCRYIPVDSKDIVDHILTKLNDKNFVTQLIRATTREISFFKDFVLAIDNAKVEALANSKRGSANPMWKVLERRAIMSRMKRFVGIKGNNANAITALVVSQEEVDFVRKNYGKNLDSMKNIIDILDAYNLIGFAVADESMETVKFVFDTGEDMVETLSFNSLEKEANDTSYKKIVNLLSKVG